MRSRPTPSPSGWRYSKKTRGTSALVSSDLNSQQTVQVPLPWLGCCNTGANRLGNRSVCRNTAPDKPRWKPFPGFPGVPQMTATSTSRFHKKKTRNNSIHSQCPVVGRCLGALGTVATKHWLLPSFTYAVLWSWRPSRGQVPRL